MNLMYLLFLLQLFLLDQSDQRSFQASSYLPSTILISTKIIETLKTMTHLAAQVMMCLFVSGGAVLPSLPALRRMPDIRFNFTRSLKF